MTEPAHKSFHCDGNYVLKYCSGFNPENGKPLGIVAAEAEDADFAARIVKCVNAHDDLVDALACFVRWADFHGLAYGDTILGKGTRARLPVVCTAEEALAKARGDAQ